MYIRMTEVVNNNRFWLIAILSLHCGTDEVDVTDRTSGPLPLHLMIQPADLTSAIGDSPVRVILEPWGFAHVTTALTQEIRTLISAESAGESVPIFTEIEIDNAADSPDPEANADYPTSILITPSNGAWPVEWVELRVGPLPETVVTPGVPAAETEVLSRFSIPSRPTLVALEICPKTEGIIRVLTRFSESLDSASVESNLAIEHGGAPCRFIREGVSVSTLTHECSGAGLEEAFRLKMNERLMGESGLMVTTYEGAKSVDVMYPFRGRVEG